MVKKARKGKVGRKTKRKEERGERKVSQGKEEKEVRVMREKKKEKGRKGGIPDALLPRLVWSQLPLSITPSFELTTPTLPHFACLSVYQPVCVRLGGGGART